MKLHCACSEDERVDPRGVRASGSSVVADWLFGRFCRLVIHDAVIPEGVMEAALHDGLLE